MLLRPSLFSTSCFHHRAPAHRSPAANTASGTLSRTSPDFQHAFAWGSFASKVPPLLCLMVPYSQHARLLCVVQCNMKMGGGSHVKKVLRSSRQQSRALNQVWAPLSAGPAVTAQVTHLGHPPCFSISVDSSNLTCFVKLPLFPRQIIGSHKALPMFQALCQARISQGRICPSRPLQEVGAIMVPISW